MRIFHIFSEKIENDCIDAVWIRNDSKRQISMWDAKSSGAFTVFDVSFRWVQGVEHGE